MLANMFREMGKFRAEDTVGEHVSHSFMGILWSEWLLSFQTCGGTSGMNVEHT